MLSRSNRLFIFTNFRSFSPPNPPFPHSLFSFIPPTCGSRPYDRFGFSTCGKWGSDDPSLSLTFSSLLERWKVKRRGSVLC